MKKKVLLLASLATLVVGGSVAAGVVFGQGESNFKGVVATAKEFTFDATVGANQFEDHYEAAKPAEVSVVTGVGSNLETFVTLPKDDDYDYGKGFGNNGRFVRSWETYSGSDFEFRIGVNNLTSISVTYGCDKTKFTVATEVHCYIDAIDEDGNWHTSVSGESGDVFNSDQTLDWVKTAADTYTVKGVRVRVGASGGSVYYGEPVYIKSVTINWDC